MGGITPELSIARWSYVVPSDSSESVKGILYQLARAHAALHPPPQPMPSLGYVIVGANAGSM